MDSLIAIGLLLDHFEQLCAQFSSAQFVQYVQIVRHVQYVQYAQVERWSMHAQVRSYGIHVGMYIGTE